MAHPPVLEAPNDFDPFALAEWLETTMLLEERSSMSRSDIRGRWASGQEPDQSEIESLFAEVRRRADLSTSLYPYRVQDNSVVVQPAIDGTVYGFFLLLSMEHVPYRLESRFNEVSPALELLTCEALKTQLGPGSRALPFGWPSSIGRPKYLGDAVRWLAEDHLGLTAGPVDEDVDEDDKDGGIDVVAWSAFGDGGPSFLLVLCQCTTQMSYERKPADVEPASWTQWIRCGRDPVVALSVPMAIPMEAKVRIKLRDRAGLVLDRHRLCELLDPRDMSALTEFACIQAWVARERTEVRRFIGQRPSKPPGIAKRRKPKKDAPGLSDESAGVTSEVTPAVVPPAADDRQTRTGDAPRGAGESKQEDV